MAHPSIVAATERYNPVARALHWTVALLVLIVLPFGAVIKFVKEDVKLDFYMVHESFGFLILWVMLARLAVRLLAPPPPPPPMPATLERLAKTVHWLLYGALILQPVLGFLMTNAYGFPLNWFYAVEVWSPVGKNDTLAALLKSAHIAVGWAILLLLVLHILGVIHHHVLRRDATLYRMI